MKRQLRTLYHASRRLESLLPLVAAWSLQRSIHKDSEMKSANQNGHLK
jgi:hypothetical protein